MARHDWCQYLSYVERNRPDGRGGEISPRKVRAPQGGPPANGWALRCSDGKCHREQTAGGPLPVRVKRRGKSPPRIWQQVRHGKPRLEQGRITGEKWPGSVNTPRVGCAKSCP